VLALLPSPDFPERFGVVDRSGEMEKFMKFIVGITREMVEKLYISFMQKLDEGEPKRKKGEKP
jgi:hypothetical protein